MTDGEWPLRLGHKRHYCFFLAFSEEASHEDIKQPTEKPMWKGAEAAHQPAPACQPQENHFGSGSSSTAKPSDDCTTINILSTTSQNSEPPGIKPLLNS